MRKQYYREKNLLSINESVEGRSLEQQLAALMQGEKMETKGKSLIYTERKDGVLPETNIRSDRMELAQEALDYVTRTEIAKRDEAPKKGTENSTGESIEGTTQN